MNHTIDIDSIKIEPLETFSITSTVDHPTYYQGKKYEAIDIIEDYNLDFHLGNAIKYILRAGKKDDKLKDLNKAIWYLQRVCQNLDKEKSFNDKEKQR